MVASHLKGYSEVRKKVPWVHNAEGVRRKSDAPHHTALSRSDVASRFSGEQVALQLHITQTKNYT